MRGIAAYMTHQTSMWTMFLCSECAGTGIEWRLRPRYDVEGDLLEVRAYTVHQCEACAGTGETVK